jgi:hypothetical protein
MRRINRQQRCLGGEAAAKCISHFDSEFEEGFYLSKAVLEHAYGAGVFRLVLHKTASAMMLFHTTTSSSIGSGHEHS